MAGAVGGKGGYNVIQVICAGFVGFCIVLGFISEASSGEDKEVFIVTPKVIPMKLIDKVG